MLFQHLLPPLRFMVTLGFFIALSLVLYHRIDIIESRLRPWYEENLEVTEYSFNKHVLSSYKTYERKANSEVIIAISFSFLSLVIQTVGQIGGCTFFHESVTVTNIIFNFIGGFCTCLYIIQSWNYQRLWIICSCCCFIPMLVELLMMYRILIQRKHKVY